MERTEQLGCGTQIAYLEMTEDLLLDKMNKVLDDPKYVENAKKISSRFKDQPQKPMERAIYWIEYVLRNENVDYMKTSAQFLNGIQYYNVDAYALIILAILTALLIPILVMRKIYRIIGKLIFGEVKSKRKIN